MPTTTAERIRELLAWDAAWMNTRPDIEPWVIHPYDMEDIHRNIFDRKFKELVEWAGQNPEAFEDGR
jgi:hypothetical protein